MTALFALASNGCSSDVCGDWYVLKHYGNVQPRTIEFQGIGYAILDKPEERRILMAPLGDASLEQYEPAARDYLARSRGECTIESRGLASGTDQTYEFFYSCAGDREPVVRDTSDVAFACFLGPGRP